jgi:uncharacterized damage-inducible protein DinB
MSETDRIWDLLQRSFEGDVWHGPALRPLLQDVTSGQAAARPIAGARTIWETVLHVAAHEDAARRRIEGEPVGELAPEESWPAVADDSAPAWHRCRERFEEIHRRLRQALAGVSDARLSEAVPGRDYPFYVMLYGLVQHALYHAGQIVLLQQAQGLRPRG